MQYCITTLPTKYHVQQSHTLPVLHKLAWERCGQSCRAFSHPSSLPCPQPILNVISKQASLHWPHKSAMSPVWKSWGGCNNWGYQPSPGFTLQAGWGQVCFGINLGIGCQTDSSTDPSTSCPPQFFPPITSIDILTCCLWQTFRKKMLTAMYIYNLQFTQPQLQLIYSGNKNTQEEHK